MPKFPDCWESCGNCAQGDVFVSEVNILAGDTLNLDDCAIVLETGKVALDIPLATQRTVDFLVTGRDPRPTRVNWTRLRTRQVFRGFTDQVRWNWQSN